MFIRGSRFSETENEIQDLKSLKAVLCIQISYLSDYKQYHYTVHNTQFVIIDTPFTRNVSSNV